MQRDSFGPSFGLSTGDPELINVPLQPGVIFTVEPRYYNYYKEVLVFTEDVILVTKDACESSVRPYPRIVEEWEAMVGKK